MCELSIEPRWAEIASRRARKTFLKFPYREGLRVSRGQLRLWDKASWLSNGCHNVSQEQTDTTMKNLMVRKGITRLFMNRNIEKEATWKPNARILFTRTVHLYLDGAN